MRSSRTASAWEVVNLADYAWSDLVGVSLELEEQGRSLYRQLSETISDDKFSESVEMLALMKETNLESLSSMALPGGNVLWEGVPVDVIKTRCLGYIENGRNEESEIRALEHALQSEEEALRFYTTVRGHAKEQTRAKLDKLVANEEKLIEELRIMIFDRFTPVVYKFKRKSS